MIKGTEQMQRYPNDQLMRQYKGIRGYGTTTWQGQKVLKVSQCNVRQLEGIGYRYVGDGNHYAYVIKPLNS